MPYGLKKSRFFVFTRKYGKATKNAPQRPARMSDLVCTPKLIAVLKQPKPIGKNRKIAVKRPGENFLFERI